MRGTRRRDTAAAPGLRRPGGALPRTCCLPSGLSPSVPEFHQVSRPMDSAGSRTITAGSELHRPRSTYCRQLVCHARYSRGHGVRHSCQGLAGTRAGDPPAGAGRRAAPFLGRHGRLPWPPPRQRRGFLMAAARPPGTATATRASRTGPLAGYARLGAPRRDRTSMAAAARSTPATTTSIHWLATPSR
jgi:hypothetical protein